MPVNVTNWDDYVHQLITDPNLLAHQMIHIINQNCQPVKINQAQSIGLNHLHSKSFTPIQQKLTKHIANDIHQLLDNWNVALNNIQSIQWKQTINQLEHFDQLLNMTAINFCVYEELIDYRAYQKYCQSPHPITTKMFNHQYNDLFDTINYLQTNLNQIIQP